MTNFLSKRVIEVKCSKCPFKVITNFKKYIDNKLCPSCYDEWCESLP